MGLRIDMPKVSPVKILKEEVVERQSQPVMMGKTQSDHNWLALTFHNFFFQNFDRWNFWHVAAVAWKLRKKKKKIYSLSDKGNIDFQKILQPPRLIYMYKENFHPLRLLE